MIRKRLNRALCRAAATAVLTSLTIATPSFAVASPWAENVQVSQWKEFFTEVLPVSAQNFAAMKGPDNEVPFVESYAVTASLPALVADCDIEHGGHPGATFWSLDCKAPQYTKDRGLAAIASDLGAALPSSFHKTTDRFGNPVWKSSSVTVAAWMILDTDNAYTVTVCHAVDAKGCDE